MNEPHALCNSYSYVCAWRSPYAKVSKLSLGTISVMRRARCAQFLSEYVVCHMHACCCFLWQTCYSIKINKVISVGMSTTTKKKNNNIAEGRSQNWTKNNECSLFSFIKMSQIEFMRNAHRRRSRVGVRVCVPAKGLLLFTFLLFLFIILHIVHCAVWRSEKDTKYMFRSEHAW